MDLYGNDVMKHRTSCTVRTGAKYRSWVLRCSCISDLHFVTFAAYSV